MLHSTSSLPKRSIPCCISSSIAAGLETSQRLDSTGEPRGRQAPHGRFAQPLTLHDSRGASHAGQRERSVARLMGSQCGKARIDAQRSIRQTDLLALEVSIENLQVEIAPKPRERRADFPRSRLDDFGGFIAQLTDHRGDAGLQDAGLFGRDLGEAVPELLRVFEFDARDARDGRCNQVRGVEPPTEAYFKHASIHFRF